MIILGKLYYNPEIRYVFMVRHELEQIKLEPPYFLLKIAKLSMSVGLILVVNLLNSHTILFILRCPMPE